MSNKQAHKFRQLQQISNSRRLPLSALLLCLALTVSAANESDNLLRNFVDIQQAIPDIEVDVRYFGEDNFVGAPIDGYGAATVPGESLQLQSHDSPLQSGNPPDPKDTKHHWISVSSNVFPLASD